MTSVFLAENTQNDGTIEDEEVFCASMATLFIGTYPSSYLLGTRADFCLAGAVDTVSRYR